MTKQLERLTPTEGTTRVNKQLLESIANIGPETIRQGIHRELSERKLDYFIKQAWPSLKPHENYDENWHIGYLSEYLKAVELGQTKRLIINIPPRHMKSLLVTVCYPAWCWATNPGLNFIRVSYSATLSLQHNEMSRHLIRSKWYQDNWNDRFNIKYDHDRKDDFENDHEGRMFSTSVGGALTGHGADRIIVDDAQSPKEAHSEAARMHAINFFSQTLQSRLDNPDKGAIIVIQQRLHEKDLTGYILSEGLNYELVKIPITAPKKTVVTYPLSGKQIVREEGDILQKSRFTQAHLDDLRKSMGSLNYTGQYMQEPAPADGSIFKREWLQSYFNEAPSNTFDIQSWDMAFKKSEGSAKVAGFVVSKKGADVYVRDLINDKMSFTESVNAVRTLTGKWPNTRAKVVEDKANGPAVNDVLKKEIPGMVEFSPQGSKEERAISVTPYFEAGNIHFPNPVTNPWVKDLVEDLVTFPRGSYKDTVDALVQAILYLMEKKTISTTPAAGTKKRSYWR